MRVFNLSFIPLNWLLFLGLMLAIVLAGLWAVFRLRKAPQPQEKRPPPLSPRHLAVGAVRLAGFGLLAIVLVGGALMFYVNMQTLENETAPARQAVDLPPDLPFAVEEVSFSGGDGIQLAGWYAAPRNGATIILLHGYGGTRAGMTWHADKLVKAGYGVLMYDERASGESGGERRSYGWEDGPDVGGALAFIRERDGAGVSRVGIAGCSMGGQIALQGAILYPEIAAVWADGPGILRAADNAPPHNILTGLVLISNYMLDFMYEQKLDLAAPAPLVERMGKIAPRPVMLVGGGVEKGLLGSESRRMAWFASAAGPHAQVWVIEEAVHCDGPKNSLRNMPGAWWNFSMRLLGWRAIKMKNAAFAILDENIPEPRLLREALAGGGTAPGGDLQAMHNLLRAGRRAMQGGAPAYFIHPGDLSWWLFYPPLVGANTANRAYVWDDPAQPGEILGLAFIGYDNEFTVFPRPDLPGEQQAAMRAWAEHTCTACARQAGKRRIVSGFISDRDSALTGYYQQNGFVYDPTCDYVCFRHDLEDLPPPVLPEGFRIADMSGEDLIPSRAAAQYGAFQSSARWEDYLQRYQRFAHCAVYTPALDRIVLSPEGVVAAFCINWLDEETGIGLFEPVGAHPDFRGRGLSKALLRHALAQLKTAGMREAIVLTNYDNTAAIGLYHAAGFRDDGRLLLFAKDVTGG